MQKPLQLSYRDRKAAYSEKPVSAVLTLRNGESA